MKYNEYLSNLKFYFKFLFNITFKKYKREQLSMDTCKSKTIIPRYFFYYSLDPS